MNDELPIILDDTELGSFEGTEEELDALIQATHGEEVEE